MCIYSWTIRRQSSSSKAPQCAPVKAPFLSSRGWPSDGPPALTASLHSLKAGFMYTGSHATQALQAMRQQIGKSIWGLQPQLVHQRPYPTRVAWVKRALKKNLAKLF